MKTNSLSPGIFGRHDQPWFCQKVLRSTPMKLPEIYLAALLKMPYCGFVTNRNVCQMTT